MQPVTLFYLTGCPYCVKAKRALEELKEENAAYEKVPLDWIEESREPELAGRYDYYYVPSLFLGERKLYEADPAQDYAAIKNSLRAALDAVLTAE